MLVVEEDDFRVDSLGVSPGSDALKCIALGIHFTSLDFRVLSCKLGLVVVPHGW